MTCQVIVQRSGARQASGAETLFGRLRVLCVTNVVNVEVVAMALFIRKVVGSMMNIAVVDVVVDAE